MYFRWLTAESKLAVPIPWYGRNGIVEKGRKIGSILPCATRHIALHYIAGKMPRPQKSWTRTRDLMGQPYSNSTDLSTHKTLVQVRFKSVHKLDLGSEKIIPVFRISTGFNRNSMFAFVGSRGSGHSPMSRFWFPDRTPSPFFRCKDNDIRTWATA